MRSPRKWSDLRSEAPAAPTSQEETIEQVLRRLWTGNDQPGDGRRVLLWMREMTSAVTPPNVPEAVLRDHEGQRRLVQRVIEMATTP